MAGWIRLERIKIVDVSELGVFVSYQQVSAIHSHRHLSRGSAGAHRRDQIIPRAVVDQHVILLLAEYVKSISSRIGQYVNQRSGYSYKRAPLVGLAIVDNNSDIGNIHGIRRRNRNG